MPRVRAGVGPGAVPAWPVPGPLGKGITLRSENGLGNCIIDRQGDGGGSVFGRHETGTLVLKGFAISNAWTSYSGGGSSCWWNSSATTTNCAVSGDTAESAGSGVLCCGNGAPTIINRAITGSTAAWCAGVHPVSGAVHRAAQS